jgi:hypothetical protein
MQEALRGHNSWQPAAASRVIRFTDQLDPFSGVMATEVRSLGYIAFHMAVFQLVSAVAPFSGVVATKVRSPSYIAFHMAVLQLVSAVASCFGLQRQVALSVKIACAVKLSARDDAHSAILD